MKEWVYAVAVILSISFSVPPVSGGANGNSAGNSGPIGSSGGSHGGGTHGGEGSHPAGISSGPAFHPGATGGIRPTPHFNSLRPYPTFNALGRSTTIPGQNRPGVSRSYISPHSRLPQSNVTGQRSQTSTPGSGTVRPQPGSPPRSVFTTRDGTPHQGTWSRRDPANKSRFDRQTQDTLRNWHGKRPDFTEACRRHDDHHRHHHNRDWWRNHCNAVVLVDWGFWGWSDGWWYPAWGYDAYYSSYEFDGPIYGYDGLLPDEIIANVQRELQRLGYYLYEIDGAFGPVTQEALANYQSDNGLPITGAIDALTLQALGLI